MATLHAYLNFDGNCEEAFSFYSSVFKKDIAGLFRYSDMPADPAAPELSDEISNKIMNVALYINDNTTIMGSDYIQEFCADVPFVKGNNTYINLAPESIQEAKDLYAGLSEGSTKIEMELSEQFWAELFASFVDKFGICWMINYEGNKKMG